MKSIVLASILALSLLSLATPQLTNAQTGVQSANGNYQFSFEDGLIKHVEFDARTDEKGNASGVMTFKDEAKISEEDKEGTEDPRAGEPPTEFFMKAEFDVLTIEKNRALMSGTVVDSSHRSYIGRWVQLVVEDNGDNIRIPDKLTWAFCQPEPGGWIPTDAERKDDDGAWLRWWATDAERKDDVGIPSKNLISNEQRGCRVLRVWSYDFIDIKRAEGNIQVRP